MPKGVEIVIAFASLVVTLFVLAVQLGFWGGGVSARAQPEDDSSARTPGRLREVIDRLETSVKDARSLAHEARNIANVTKGQSDAWSRQMERDLERIDRSMQENTRRIDELWRVMRSGGGEGV